MLSFVDLLQEIVRPDIFWYDAPTKIDLPFNIVGLLAFEFWAMQFVELKRWQDFKNPGSVDQDPLFPNNKLAPHEVSICVCAARSCLFKLFNGGKRDKEQLQQYRTLCSPSNKLAQHEVSLSWIRRR